MELPELEIEIGLIILMLLLEEKQEDTKFKVIQLLSYLHV
jgi:hypothetical protein